MHRTCIRSVLGLLVLISCGSIARADEVTLSDGNKLTGKIGNIAGGKMKFSSDSLGDITIDMAKVKSYTTDAPAVVQVKSDGHIDKVSGKVTAGDVNSVTVEGKPSPLPMDTVKQINPPAQKWTGSIVANGLITRGNSHETGLGVSADATLRRDDPPTIDDRFTLAGAYQFSKQRSNDTGDDSTTADNWFALAKYDLFFTDKLYGYANIRYDHDRIAFLNYRLSPGVGAGYQWFEQPDFNLSTEAGVSYVYEDYSNDGTDDRVALRLAYHIDKKFNDKVGLFHNLEWLPSFTDPSDYNLNADAGVRATLTKTMFAEFKIQYLRDSTPAPTALKNDLRYTLGVGWTF